MEEVHKSLQKFPAGAEQDDDITMVAKETAGEVLTVHINNDLNIKTSPLFE